SESIVYFSDTPSPPLISTLSLHDALPISVIDGDFRHRTGIQGIEQLRVGEKHGFLILPAGHQIVDVAELIGFGELVPHKEDAVRSEEHTSELQSRFDLVCRLLLEKKKTPR